MATLKQDEVIQNACEWIEALAQADYPQGFNQLKDKERRYCCLGAGREVMGGPQGDSCMGYLSYQEQGDLGLKGFHVQRRLARFNDSMHLTHPQIAVRILLHPRTFFRAAVARGVEEHFFGGGHA